MRRIIASAVVAGSALAGFAFLTPAAHADGQVCFNAHVVVNGQDVVNQAQCQPLTAPSLP